MPSSAGKKKRHALLLVVVASDPATTEIYTPSLHDALPISNAWTTCRSPARRRSGASSWRSRSEEHTSELQSRPQLVCRLLLEKKNVTLFSLLLLLVIRRPPRFTLLPYTTLFRSRTRGLRAEAQLGGVPERPRGA